MPSNLPRYITVLFSCEGCGLKDVPAKVPAREDPEKQDVIEWVRGPVSLAISFLHSMLRPNCQSNKIKDLKIPVCEDSSDKDSDNWVGKYTRNRSETF